MNLLGKLFYFLPGILAIIIGTLMSLILLVTKEINFLIFFGAIIGLIIISLRVYKMLKELTFKITISDNNLTICYLIDDKLSIKPNEVKNIITKNDGVEIIFKDPARDKIWIGTFYSSYNNRQTLLNGLKEWSKI